MKNNLVRSFLFILLTITFSACVPETNVSTLPILEELFGGGGPQEQTLFISSDTTPCGNARCLLVRTNGQDSWETLDLAIIGFEYELNTAYTLRVREDVISGTTVLRLVDIVEQSYVEPEVIANNEGSEITTDTDSSTETNTTNTEISEAEITEPQQEASETELQAPTETIVERELLLFVDQTLGACSIDNDSLCLRIRENRNDAWQNLASDITGFNYIPGNYYVLRVAEQTITTQTTQQGTGESTQEVSYSLLDLVSQTSATQEKLVYIGPEILSCDETGDERCYQYKESRSVDYVAKPIEIIGFNHQDGYAYALNLLLSLDENSDVRSYELIEVVNQELLADGRYVEKIIYVGPELETCTFGPSNLCYVFRESLNEPYRILSSDITGFRHQAGFDYELKVRQNVLESENGNARLELVEILKQTAVIEEATQTTEEETSTEEISTEETSTETETSESSEPTEPTAESRTEEAVQEEAVQEEAVQEEEQTSNTTINETIAKAAQAQLENTASVVTEEERRNVMITVAPADQRPLEVPDLASTDAEVTTDEVTTDEATENVDIATEVTSDSTTGTNVDTEASQEETATASEEPSTSFSSLREVTSKGIAVLDFGELEVVDEQERIIFIGSSYQECGAAGEEQPQQWCYLTKNNIQEDWFLLPYGIANFDYVEGFVYVIRIRESFYGTDAAGKDRFGLELIEVMAQTEDKSFTIVQEEERRKEQTAALEEAALIAQTFEDEAAVLVDKEAEQAALEEQNRAEAEAIATDTQTAIEKQPLVESDKTEVTNSEGEATNENAPNNSQTDSLDNSITSANNTSATMTVSENPNAAPVAIETSSTSKVVFIAEQLARCQPEGLPEQLCYAYKEKPEDDWQLLYNEIVNFEFFVGFIYELEVIENFTENLPTELGRWFELVETRNVFPVATDN